MDDLHTDASVECNDHNAERQMQAYHAALQPYEALFALWSKSSNNRRQTTLDDYWHALQTFADFVQRKPLLDITRRDVVAYRDQLLASGLQATTATNRVSIIKALFNTAINYELLETNPADGIRTQRNSSEKTRIAFSADDLRRIFNSPIYLDNYRPKVGGREACYWLPLLALFSGARVEELAQLLVNDVHYRADLGHYLNISDEAEHAKLKNASSRRRVPVHPVLVACGFIDYVQSMQAGKLLFPHLAPNPRGKLAGYFSNFFSIYLRKRVRITDKRKVFHSFRHTFKDTCRKLGIEEAVHDALTGHTNHAVSRRYGNALYPLEPLFEAMQRYELADVDLSHLFRHPYVSPSQQQELKMVSAFYGVVMSFASRKMHLPQDRTHDAAAIVIARHHGAEAGFDVARNRVVFGQLPEAKQCLVHAWVELHREELMASWVTGRTTGEYFRVEPLR